MLEWPAIECLAAGVVAVAAAAGGWLARGSTAVPAAAWAVSAAAALGVEAACRWAGRLDDPASAASARLGVAALSACPAMSLLGAKRPQHGVWQAIVASLAGVLALPAASATLIRPGSMPDVHGLARGLLAAVILAGFANFAATRHGLAAGLIAAGQAGLAWRFLPGLQQPLPAALEAAAAVAAAAGSALAVLQSSAWPVGARRGGGPLAASCEPPFLAIRETLGAAWTLRIAERFNAEATARGWPCRLSFSGMESPPGTATDEWAAPATRCLRAILRRFVTDAWLERRGGLGTAVGGSAPPADERHLASSGRPTG